MATQHSRAVFGLLPQLRFEPTRKRIRADLAGNAVVDTLNAYLIWEPRRITPVYAVPEVELQAELVPAAPEDAGEHAVRMAAGGPPVLDPRTGFGHHTTDGETLSVRAGGIAAEGAAFRPADLDLAGYVVLEFGAFTWREDDEEIFAHPRDPFKRVDIRASSRHIQVALDGVVLADTVRAQLLYETLLPVRSYFPLKDVRMELLEPTSKRTACPYKGHASYFTYPGSPDGDNIAWTYDALLWDSAPIHGLICFFQERSDLIIDGVMQERPVTPWSRTKS